MYILGLMNKPDTFIAVKDSPVMFAAKHRDLARAKPGHLIFSMFLPEVERAFITGIHGKMDTLTIFTTFEEMNAQRTKYGRFFTPREIYHLELKVSGGPSAEAPHPRPAA